MKVYIKYGFIFEPAEIWPNVVSFEADIARFFSERNLQAELIETADGQETLRIVYISPKPMIDIPKNDVSKSKENLRVEGKGRDFQGRFK